MSEFSKTYRTYDEWYRDVNIWRGTYPATFTQDELQVGFNSFQYPREFVFRQCNRQKAQDAARHTGVTLQALSEFHERLKLHVKQLTCDVERDEFKFTRYAAELSDKDRYNLLFILYKELMQVVEAVETAQ